MKNTTPTVTVIIPIFNGASFLLDAVRSVQKSTYRKFEMLLINDGSTDQSKFVCKELSGKYPNVRFYDFHTNKGLGRVLNFALKKARGKYICRLNQDDLMLPHRLKTQIEYLDSHPAVVAVGSSIRLFDENNQWQTIQFLPTDKQIKEVWHIISPFSDPSVMYRKETALNVGGYDQSFWPADDTQLWYKMGMHGKLANLQKPVVNVRWHKNAGSVKFFRKLADSTYRMHNWADTHIEKAPWYVHVFWIAQYICGMLLPTQFNWDVYRILKRTINYFETHHNRFTNWIKNMHPVASVKIQPSIASLSGV